MSSICNITGRLYGRLKTNIERGVVAGKTPFAAFSVGSYNWRTKENDFFSCVAFGKQAESMARYFCQKRAVSIGGRLQVNKYKDKDGNDRREVQIVCTHVDYPTDGDGVPSMFQVNNDLAASKAAESDKEKNPEPPGLDEDPDGLPF